ncbi:MAG: replicative DNA helicase [Egibacteraceae bacterium]
MAAQPDVGVSPSPASYDRVPPHNLDAEVSVLGSMLLSRDAIAEVSEFVGPEDFYRGAHRTIYESARDLYDRGEPVDPVTLTDELDRRGTLSDVGGVVAVADLVARVPTAANALYYARIVAEHALRRRLIDAGTQITRLGYQAEGADEAVDSAEALVYQVAQRNRGREFTSMKQLLTASFELIERLHDNASAVTGLSTGFRDFDQCTAGLQPSNLVILAARPAMGKCLAGDAMVIRSDTGALQRLDEIVRDPDPAPLGIASLGPDGTLRGGQAVQTHDNGMRAVWRLCTTLGREIVATANHPFLTASGWVPLARLAGGDRIATPRALPFFGSDERPDDEVVHAARALRSSPGAQVPDAVFRLPSRQVALFLNRLFEMDNGGASSLAAGVRRIHGCLSQPLAAQLQHLLLRFGIVTTRTAGLDLHLADRDSAERFSTQIVARDGAHQSERFDHSLGSDIYWDEIVSIEPAGEQRVFDLTVPGDHNFVAQDIIVHNSTLVTNIAAHVAVNERKPVVLFSLEMSQMELVLRILAGEARVDSERLRTGRLQEADWPKLSQAMGRLAEAPLFIDDTAGINLMEIRSKCRRLKQKHGLDLVVLDYLQLMQPTRRIDNRVQEVAELSRGLKILAKELNVPVIALSQLSRKPEDRSDRRPQLSDLRDSGSIEQDADIVCFIYRDEVYDKESAAKGEAELIIAKHRNGPLSTIHLAFLAQHSLFKDMARGPAHGNGRPSGPRAEGAL